MISSPATHQTATARGPTRTCCRKCGRVVSGPLTVVEISHLGDRGPVVERVLLCDRCGSLVAANLTGQAERYRRPLRGGLDRCGGGFAGLSRADATPIAIRRK